MTTAVTQLSRETKNLIRTLERLREEGDSNMFARVQTAARLIQDVDYLELEHGGDQTAAADYIRDRYFAMVGGFIHPLELFAIMETFPDEKDWALRKYDLQLLLDDHKDALRAAATGVEGGTERKAARRISIAEYDKLDDAHKEVVYSLKREREVSCDQAETIEQLQTRIRELELENAALKARVGQLEKIVDRGMK